MKKLLTICLIPLIISCAPVLWQYDNDKWVSSKEKVELAWDYGEDKIDYFEIDREVVKIEKDDYEEIKNLVKDKNVKKLIDKENKYREKITYDKIVIRYPAAEKRSYIDKEKPLPTFGEICFYQVFSVVHPDPKKPKVIKSDPAVLSVIILPRFK
jgi:hypothetical protein